MNFHLRNILLIILGTISTNLWSQNVGKMTEDVKKAIDEHSYTKALMLLDSLINYYPDSIDLSRAYRDRGISHYFRMEYEDAIDDYTKAYELDPEFDNALRLRGYTKKRMGRFEEALIDYNLALGIYPENRYTNFNKCIVLDTLGRREEACESCEFALINGEEAAASYLAQRCGASNDALKKYEFKVLSDKSTDDSYGYNLGNAIYVGHSKMGHGPSAQRAFLDLLLDSKGNKVKYKRLGQGGPDPYPDESEWPAIVDLYEVKYKDDSGKKRKVNLYISFYRYEQPMIPVGFHSLEEF